MSTIIIDEYDLRKYIDGALKYKALLNYDVREWCGYYDALDIFKDEEVDIYSESDSIEDFSKLVDKEIEWLKNNQLEERN